jgi:hypothetical protein
MRVLVNSVWMYKLLTILLVCLTIFTLVIGIPQKVSAASATPANFTAVLNNDKVHVDLSWDSVIGVDGYHIEASTHDNFSPTSIVYTVGPSLTSYQDGNVYAGATFYYRITSYLGSTESPPSDVASVTITLVPPTTPSAPTNLQGTVVGGTRIDLTWNESSLNVVSFLLEKATQADFSNATSFLLPGNQKNYSDNPVEINTTYYYRVSAINASGSSGPSNTLTISTNQSTLAVNAGSDASIIKGETFSGSGSFSDNAAGPWTAIVNYGEGGNKSLTLSGKNFSLSHLYNNTGSYTITVSVTNNLHITASDSLIVVVSNPVPEETIAVDAGQNVTINEGNNFTGGGSFTDPGSGPWTGTVDYQDGAGVEPLSLNEDKTFSLDHTYGSAGVYDVSVVITSEAGKTGSSTVEVTVQSANGIPVAPSNLKAVKVSTDRVDLTWTDNSGNEKGFKLYESVHEDFSTGIVRTINANATSFRDTLPYAGAAFYYRISAFDDAGESEFSNVDSVNIPLPQLKIPSAPTNLKSSLIGNNQVNLRWKDTSGVEVGFLIERATDSEFTKGLFSPITGANLTEYTDIVRFNGTYHYRVKAFNVLGNSKASNVITVEIVNGENRSGGGGTSGAGSLKDISLTGLSSTETQFQVDQNGNVQQTVNLVSSDQGASLLIPQGTQILDSTGKAISEITCIKVSELNNPKPEGVVINGYNFGPDGATFNPAITLMFIFDPENLPAGIDLDTLNIVSWNGTTWQKLDSSQINLQSNQVVVTVSHFTIYALIGEIKEETSSEIEIPGQTETSTVAPDIPLISNSTILPLTAPPEAATYNQADDSVQPTKHNSEILSYWPFIFLGIIVLGIFVLVVFLLKDFRKKVR